MRLKAIKLAGFKSFVDPTTVAFSTNMTGIVGPNGCGKSNTIDAVRWVMGESSAKYLRGDAMTDVIFNGSSGRKPVGKASVELIFDNTDRTLKGEYAGYNEISVRRQVTRDGQSSYFMNGSRCRRKDITNLFLGTGLGPRSYAIIEQGMISRLIEAKPEELRIYVEEAAGISRYKDRRRETENRMRRTLENLERLQDIRDELERQLEHLHRQADAAEKYKSLKAEERLKKAQLHGLKWQQLDSEYRERELKIGELDVRFEEQMSLLRTADSEIEVLRLDQTRLNDSFHEQQARFYEVGARIARQEQKIEHQSQLSLELDRSLTDVEGQITDAQNGLEQDQLALAQLDEEILLFEPELALTVELVTEAAESLSVAESEQARWQDEWQNFTQKAGEPARRAEVTQARILSLQQQQSQIIQRQQRLQQEGQELESSDSDELLLLQEEASEFELRAESHQMSLDSLRERVELMRDDIEQRRLKLQQGQSQLQQLAGRKATLEALQKAAMGAGDLDLNEWLEKHQLARLPRLASSLQVQAGWELAVERLLGDHLQAILVENFHHAEHWLRDFTRGRLVVRHADVDGVLTAAGSMPPDSLIHQCRSQYDLAGVLGLARCVDSLFEALRKRDELEPAQFFITRDGIRVGREWIMLERGDSADSGILARQQELEEVAEAWDLLDMDVDEWQADLDAAILSLKSLQQQQDQAQRELQQFHQQQMSVQARLSALQARADQASKRRQQLDEELQELAERAEGLNEELLMQQEEWQEANLAIEEFADLRDQLTERQEMLRSSLEEARSRTRQLQEQQHQAQMRSQQLSHQKSSLQADVSRHKSQLEALFLRKREIVASQQRDQNADLETLKTELQNLLEERQREELITQQARQAMEAVEQSLKRREADRTEAEAGSLRIRNEREAVRMECQALDIRRQALVEQLKEEKLTLKEVLEAMPEEAKTDLWQQQLQQISDRIRRLGNINLAAIDEYKLQSERKEYLDSQHKDLETALLTLENAIVRIDRETRARFKETFDRINGGLGDLFPKVFGGGHAWLELTGDDLLDTGVAIMARPPGKKNSTIHLLSGGEKALTAIALVFSIFRLNPAPFCMLDEVDAPLDDANVGRYARLVHAMSDQVQFIYITHNKIAMEMAAHLLGVTMHEPGVSRLVTVDVEAAAEMIEQ